MGRHGRRQRIHPDPCAAWSGPASIHSQDLDASIAGQLRAIRLDAAAEARVRAVVGSVAPVPADTSRARIRRRLRDVALEHADGKMTDVAYLAESARLRTELEATAEPRSARVTPDEAIAAIRGLEARWSLATDDERARLAHLVYARIPMDGASVGPVELTPWAYELGIDQAMPELVRLDWRPRQVPGTQVHTVRVPIAGRRERLAAARRSA